jgi:hypothetical protein
MKRLRLRVDEKDVEGMPIEVKRGCHAREIGGSPPIHWHRDEEGMNKGESVI